MICDTLHFANALFYPGLDSYLILRTTEAAVNKAREGWGARGPPVGAAESRACTRGSGNALQRGRVFLK